MRTTPIARRAAMLASACLLALTGSCNDILTVSNPEQISVKDLDDLQLLNAQVAGVISEFASTYTRNGGAILWSTNFLTDEQVTGLNWEDYARVNQRIVRYSEGPVASLWAGLSRIVRIGDDVTARIESLVDANDRRIATTSLYAAYGYLLAGESMCSTTYGTATELASELLTPTQTFQRAIARFERAITIATATGQPAIANAARVGLARTYLNLKNFPKVIEFASVVPVDFKFWVLFSEAQDAETNGLFGRTHGSNHTMGVSPFFLQGTFGQQNIVATQTDPRIQHFKSWTRGHNGLTQLYKPFQGLRFSDYSGLTQAPASPTCPNCTGTVASSSGDTGPLLIYQKGTNVLLADGLEAKHHLMEAKVRAGGADAEVLVFVNSRRAVGNQAPTTATGTALFAALREQRSRDFYQGGFRLGDLRRWKRDGVGDFFPTGNHVNQEWGAYGTWTCFPLPLSEYEGNPNLPKPADPLSPPAGA